MIPFIDLDSQQQRISEELNAAISRVLSHGAYIMGPEVKALEEALCAFSNTKHALSCSNGTDAITLFLRAKNVGAGDAVIVPSFTFIATAETVALCGATPIFIDVDEDSYNLNPNSLQEGLVCAKKEGLNPVGVISVDLFGRPAEYTAIGDFCKNNDLWFLADAAQAFGATYNNTPIGTLADATTTSFFPAKPLGCYGDGGAIFTQDNTLNDTMKSLRVHGKGDNKYDNIRIGMNARMDTIQAAILIEKLKIFPDEIIARNALATSYNQAFKDILITPNIPENCTSTWAQYVLRIDASRRENLLNKLKERNIPTVVYYPIPLHQQKAYSHYPHCNPDLSEKLSTEVFSLPMHPYMDDATRDMIIDEVTKAVTA